MIIKKFTLGEYQSNCYVIAFKNEAIIVDPGYENDKVIPYLEKASLKPKYIFLTHGHFDHIGGVNQIKKHFENVEVLIHQDDVFWLENNSYNLTKKIVHYDKVITSNGHIFLDERKLEILLTPGHSPGGMSLIFDGHIFSGDTIFKMSIGRYDFPFSNYEKLVESVKNLYLLPDYYIVHPGHGEDTTIGFEKKYNYYIKG